MLLFFLPFPKHVAEQYHLWLFWLLPVRDSRSDKDIWRSLTVHRRMFCLKGCLRSSFPDFKNLLSFPFIALRGRFIFQCVFFLAQAYTMLYPNYIAVYNRNGLGIFMMCLLLLPCCVLRSPGGKARWVLTAGGADGWRCCSSLALVPRLLTWGRVGWLGSAQISTAQRARRRAQGALRWPL